MSDSQQDETGKQAIFVRRRGKVEGPWTSTKLKSEVKLRKLSRFHEVSTDKENWSRAESLDWLFPKVESRRKTQAPIENSVAVQLGESDVVSSSLTPTTFAGSVNDGLDWFLGIDGEEVGPLTTAAVAHKISMCEVGLTDLIWRDGFQDWAPIAHLPEFASLLDQYRPQATQPARGSASPQNPSKIENPAPSVSQMATWSLIVGLVAFPSLTIVSTLLGLISVPYMHVGLWLSIPVGTIAAILGLLALQNLSRADSQQKGKSRAAIGLITGASAALSFTSIVLFGLIYNLIYS